MGTGDGGGPTRQSLAARLDGRAAAAVAVEAGPALAVAAHAVGVLVARGLAVVLTRRGLCTAVVPVARVPRAALARVRAGRVGAEGVRVAGVRAQLALVHVQTERRGLQRVGEVLRVAGGARALVGRAFGQTPGVSGQGQTREGNAKSGTTTTTRTSACRPCRSARRDGTRRTRRLQRESRTDSLTLRRLERVGAAVAHDLLNRVVDDVAAVDAQRHRGRAVELEGEGQQERGTTGLPRHCA